MAFKFKVYKLVQNEKQGLNPFDISVQFNIVTKIIIIYQVVAILTGWMFNLNI